MNKYLNQRSCNRNHSQQSVLFSRWGGKDCYKARVVDCSEDGISFMSDFPYLPQTEIAIKVMKDDEESLASVVWSEPVSVDGKKSYRIGAKFFEPI